MARLPRGRVRVVGAEEALAICHHALLEGAGVRQRHGLSIRRFHSGFRSPLPHMPHNLSATAASVNCVRTQSRGGSFGRPDEIFPTYPHLLALRISAGCDGGEWGPVGAASVEQDPDAVVAKTPEPEGHQRDPRTRNMSARS